MSYYFETQRSDNETGSLAANTGCCVCPLGVAVAPKTVEPLYVNRLPELPNRVPAALAAAQLKVLSAATAHGPLLVFNVKRPGLVVEAVGVYVAGVPAVLYQAPPEIMKPWQLFAEVWT